MHPTPTEAAPRAPFPDARAEGAVIGLEAVFFAPPDHPPIVAGVDWNVPQGAFHVLIGRSGCGKTTLLKLAAGLLEPSSGTVRVEGRVLRGPAEAMGFVFQAPTLLDWLSALDNVLLPLVLKRRSGAAERRRALDLLARLGLDGLGERYPAQLSGGQQARVAIARALIDAPRVLLLDEPFAALDALTREELQDDLARLCARSGITVLLVTHDTAEAVYLADGIALMATGRIVGRFAVDLPRPRPAGIRYEADFNARCRAVRAALDRAR